jgi:HTH-type transcriptional regulator/antitoxin HigA
MSDEPLTCGDALKGYLRQRGWGQADLAQVIGKTTAAVNEIIHGKRAISAEMAALLATAFGTTTSFWLTLDSSQRVTQGTIDDTKRRARLYELAPVREMIRRGWIPPSTDVAEIERNITRLFNIGSVEETPSLSVSTRRSAQQECLSPSQRAWCFYARNLATGLIVSPFLASQLQDCENRLKALFAYAPEVRRVPGVLADFGIRFVVVEPLSGSQIDGAAMWLDDASPVIAMSLRMDRIDSFWYTLMHEFSHIRHGDGLSVDSRLTGEDAEFSVEKESFERRADEEASGSLIPRDTLTSFIRRVSPMYSKDRIIQFAHKIKVHPGIIVGQLQHRGEVKYRSMRDMLVNIRKRITDIAVTDGWGQSVS